MGKTTNLICLNPFSFRAGVLQINITFSPRGDKSQSLFIQGWGTTHVHYCQCPNGPESQSLFIQGWGTTVEVVKPLPATRSQSLFIQGWGTTYPRQRWCINGCVSIPFHSGLGYYARKSGTFWLRWLSQSLFIQGWGTTHWKRKCGYDLVCLNPFSFRAGVLRNTYLISSAQSGLNPFSFRAGVLPKTWSCCITRDVSIPFHSGLGYYHFGDWKHDKHI